MRKLGLVAVIALAFLALSCETPVDEPVVNVRIYNDWGDDMDLDLKLGTVVFDFSLDHPLPPATYTAYKSINAGSYELEYFLSSEWKPLDPGTMLDMLTSGNYTVTIDNKYNTSVAKD